MVAVRFQDWDAKLRALGCEPENNEKSLLTAEWWRCPWGSRFVVPAEADGRMDEWALRRLMADINKLAPKGWSFANWRSPD
jgi:hypothetical protein